MSYYVYEDAPTNRATVHVGTCGFCRDGQGTARRKRPSSEWSWSLPYASQDEARRHAAATGRPVFVHRCCGEDAATPVSASYKRYEVPNVDEATLSLDQLFERRLRQLYVWLREEHGYRATRFLQSINRHGGVEHAKRALRRPLVSQQGFDFLHEVRHEKSMEAHVCDPQFASLFTAWEIAEARQRLGPPPGHK